jgi:outer membrane protein OmpA-like peptidoglycan-associated protein
MRLVAPIRFAALALSGALALGATAAAQTAPGVSVNWDALKQPTGNGASVDWSALPGNRPAPEGATAPVTIHPPLAGDGASVDWSALGGLAPVDKGASSPVILHPPAAPKVAATPPKPVVKPAENPLKPALPMVATVSPPRLPAAPQTAAPIVPAVAPALLPGKPAILRFAKGQTDVSAEGRDLLGTIAAELASNPQLRLQLVAHASDSGNDPVESRRLSLSRAVQLRSYLIDKGVASVRIDVRALGSRDLGDGPPDRVDLVLVER